MQLNPFSLSRNAIVTHAIIRGVLGGVQLQILPFVIFQDNEFIGITKIKVNQALSISRSCVLLYYYQPSKKLIQQPSGTMASWWFPGAQGSTLLPLSLHRTSGPPGKLFEPWGLQPEMMSRLNWNTDLIHQNDDRTYMGWFRQLSLGFKQLWGFSPTAEGFCQVKRWFKHVQASEVEIWPTQIT